ncbi:hypothetical protein Q9189_007790 [Teloschistes chrysophthalmus]
MSSQDPNPSGGSLSDMAVSGTTVPSSSAIPNTIPSVPQPDQQTYSKDDPNDLGSTDLAGAADNVSDMPRVRPFPTSPPFPPLHPHNPIALTPPTQPAQSTLDKAPPSQIITAATGDTLPAETATKNLQELGNPDLSKGHARYDKHVRQKKGSDQERGAVGVGGEDEE